MKKFFTFSLVSLVLFSIVSSPGFSQNVQKLIDQVIEATGGRKVMEAIKDTSFSGTMDLVQMGMSATYSFYHKEPNMLRQDIQVMGMAIISAFDGETGWTVNPQTGAREDMSEQEQEVLKTEAMGFGNSGMLYPEKYGITFVAKDNETIEGKVYRLFEMTFENGDTTLYYIDPETFLPFKTKAITLNQMGIEVEQESIFGDYREVNGLNFAHLITIFQDGEEFASVVVSELKFNAGLEDSLFKK